LERDLHHLCNKTSRVGTSNQSENGGAVVLLSGQIRNTTGGSVGSVNQLPPPLAPVGRIFLSGRRLEQGAAKASIQSQRTARVDPLYLFLF
jgi:hypothetical protein